MSFNENTRVKIPAILHLCRLGYSYLPLSNATPNGRTNIFEDVFLESILRINADLDQADAKRALENVALTLDNEDLGRAFYGMLTATSGVRLVDFTDFDNNSFHVVTELTYKNGDDEFRPDVTLLVNGMPLAFLEVKKPNNREGVLAERDRINARFKNKKFRRFINISQILVFSNNMEYDPDSIEPIQGAFYAPTSYSDTTFNYFREEDFGLARALRPDDPDLENAVLRDNNLSAIKHSPEFATNKDPNTPTNRILTSLFCRERLAILLRYGIDYVKTETGLEKHIMRYPQFFATKAIERAIGSGQKKGIIWHTQGSGKTALAFYNVQYLTDVFQRKDIVPKFYFVVDRIDLMTQASGEFTSRGLSVQTVNSRDELINHFRTQQALHNLGGQREITVVNIQKFKEQSDVLKTADYNVNIQRIYFLDEVHRSYDPNGSFLANLFSSDRNAILIGLTGTPLIRADRRSRDTFGKYIHRYYYNASIADGYTLRLIREGIETKYRLLLEQALREVEILRGDVEKRVVYAHDKFVEPMLDYVVEDFVRSRTRFGDDTIGGMVVCDSANQARTMFKIFLHKYNHMQETVEPVPPYTPIRAAAPEYTSYTERLGRSLFASLILYDVGSKDERKQEVIDFKEGKIDLLFVYNMLLTGFDSKRLKKLYIGRLVKDHNLLQMLTRVNRPYRDFKYGFVVDFADIRKEFDATNRAYFEELQLELGDEIQTYSDLFKSPEEIESEIADLKEKLFSYDLTNAELFSRQISEIEDRTTMLEIKNALQSAKSMYDAIRLSGRSELLTKLDFHKLNDLYNEASRHLELLNLKDSIQNNIDTTNLLNAALENIVFMFRKVSEDELVIADELKDMLRRTREALAGNFDQADPEFVSLYEELKRLFDKKNLDEITQEEMRENIGLLHQIFDKVTELNRRNNLLRAKYEHDAKYARLHKRIVERRTIAKHESEIHGALVNIKQQADERVLINRNMLNNESYFEQLMINIVIANFEQAKVKLEAESARYVNKLLVREYIGEFQGVSL